MRRWTIMDPPPLSDELAVVLDGVGYPKPAYRPSNDEKIGNLLELWPDCARSPLFGAVLELVAEAWQVNIDKLTCQSGWHHSSDTVWGRIFRL